MVMRLASTPETALPKVFATMIEFKKSVPTNIAYFTRDSVEGLKF
jgi:hypothetical protein